MLARREFLAGLRTALDSSTGYAAAKVGLSELAWLSARALLDREESPVRRRAIEAMVNFHATAQGGIFPAGMHSVVRFADYFGAHLGGLDYIGVPGGPLQAEVVEMYSIANEIGQFDAAEPDRSTPDDPSNCYLPWLAGRRVLLVSSCADLLAARAHRETFESVWSRTGKKWWNPSSVGAIEFPSTYDARTRTSFASSIDLVEHVWDRVSDTEFDVALLGAGYLGVPLAARIRGQGRVAISLGGHLQVLFGVKGKRWSESSEWRERYVNDSWIDMPERYRPVNDTGLPDGGAYW